MWGQRAHIEPAKCYKNKQSLLDDEIPAKQARVEITQTVGAH
jgi:hypothetical protein